MDTVTTCRVLTPAQACQMHWEITQFSCTGHRIQSSEERIPGPTSAASYIHGFDLQFWGQVTFEGDGVCISGSWRSVSRKELDGYIRAYVGGASKYDDASITGATLLGVNGESEPALSMLYPSTLSRVLERVPPLHRLLVDRVCVRSRDVLAHLLSTQAAIAQTMHR